MLGMQENVIQTQAYQKSQLNQKSSALRISKLHLSLSLKVSYNILV